MKKHALHIKGKKVTTTVSVLTQLMRLHQITCGYVTADDGTTQNVESNRINEYDVHLRRDEGKAIIWANYQMSVGEIIQKIIKTYGKGFLCSLLWSNSTRRLDKKILYVFKQILSVDLL